MEKTRMYDGFIISSIRLFLLWLTYYFGSVHLLLVKPAETYYVTTLIFSLGFVFEFGTMISDHYTSKEKYCRRIKWEIVLGFLGGTVAGVLCLIKMSDGGLAIVDGVAQLDFAAWSSLAIGFALITIVGIECYVNGYDFLARGDQNPTPSTQQTQNW